MPRVLVAGKLHDSGLQVLRSAAGITLDYVEEVSARAYVPHIGDADALLIRTQPLTAEIVAAAPRLRIVSRHGVGYDTVDVAALSRRSIPLTVVGDVNSRSVAEHAMMLLLAASKRAIRADAAVRCGDWEYRNALEARDVAGKRLLIVGYGRIGRTLATMARAFQLDVHAYDPFIDPAAAVDDLVTMAPDLPAALASADFVSVHVPKSDGPLIGAAELAVMKPTAVLINTARGGVIDEPALLAALRDGTIAAAGLDVFATEPPTAEAGEQMAFAPLDQAVLSPHLAGLSEECAARMAVAAARNIVDFFAGDLDTALIVNARECGMAAPHHTS